MCWRLALAHVGCLIMAFVCVRGLDQATWRGCVPAGTTAAPLTLALCVPSVKCTPSGQSWSVACTVELRSAARPARQGEEVYFTDAAAAFRTLNLGAGGGDSSSSSDEEEGGGGGAWPRQRGTRPVRRQARPASSLTASHAALPCVVLSPTATCVSKRDVRSVGAEGHRTRGHEWDGFGGVGVSELTVQPVAGTAQG